MTTSTKTMMNRFVRGFSRDRWPPDTRTFRQRVCDGLLFTLIGNRQVIANCDLELAGTMHIRHRAVVIGCHFMLDNNVSSAPRARVLP